MTLSPEDEAQQDSMHEDYQALQDAVWSAESKKEQMALSFSGNLDSAITRLRKQVLDIRLIAQHDMLLDPRGDAKVAHVCWPHFLLLERGKTIVFGFFF
jgi:hypothetical protein